MLTFLFLFQGTGELAKIYYSQIFKVFSKFSRQLEPKGGRGVRAFLNHRRKIKYYVVLKYYKTVTTIW